MATRGSLMLEKLYAELLIGILGHLSGKELAQYSRLSRTFRSIISSYSVLSYKIECFLAGVLDGPSAGTLSLSDRLAALKQWRAARRALQLTAQSQTEHISVPFFVLKTFGPVYIERHENTLKLFQPESKYAGRTAGEWALEFDFQPEDFVYDHSQRLLIVLERCTGPNSWRLHFLSSETGQAHPSAVSSVIEMKGMLENENTNDAVQARVQIQLCGTKVGCLCRRYQEDSASILFVWDWTSSALVFNVYGTYASRNEPRHFAFLDPNNIIVPSSSISVGGVEQGAGFAVFPILPVDGALKEFSFDRATLVMGLPEVATGGSLWITGMDCSPPSPPEHMQPGEDIFLPDPSSGSTLLVVKATAFPDEERGDVSEEIRFAVRLQTIFSLLAVRRETTHPKTHPAPSHPASAQELLDSPSVVTWTNWAQHARIIESEGILRVSQARTLHLSDTGRARNAIRIYEPVVHDFDTAPSILQELTAASEAGEAVESTVTTKRSLAKCSPLWANPVSTELPCRVSRGQLAAIAIDDVYLGEDYVIVLRNFMLQDHDFSKEIYSLY